MKTLTIKPTDTRHLLLASLGVLAVSFSDVKVHSTPRFDDLWTQPQVISVESKMQDPKRTTPVCVETKERRRQYENVCKESKEERHGLLSIKPS